jgi:hypothetical protein
MPLIRDDDGGYLEIRGRGFVYYHSALGQGYQVNSEMVASDDYDIAVYASDVTLIDGRTQVAEPERAEVISRVKKLCERGHIRIRVFD